VFSGIRAVSQLTVFISDSRRSRLSVLAKDKKVKYCW